MEIATGNKGGHIKSFWPLTIIAVLAVIAGGLIMWVSFNQQLDDEMLSLVFGRQKSLKSQNITR